MTLDRAIKGNIHSQLRRLVGILVFGFQFIRLLISFRQCRVPRLKTRPASPDDSCIGEAALLRRFHACLRTDIANSWADCLLSPLLAKRQFARYCASASCICFTEMKTGQDRGHPLVCEAAGGTLGTQEDACKTHIIHNSRRASFHGMRRFKM